MVQRYQRIGTKYAVGFKDEQTFGRPEVSVVQHGIRKHLAVLWPGKAATLARQPRLDPRDSRASLFRVTNSTEYTQSIRARRLGPFVPSE